MSLTPAELLAKVQAVIKEQEEYTQTLIMETLGLRWGSVALLAGVPAVVTLSQPYGAGIVDYDVWRQVTMADGTYAEVEISAKSNLSFTVTAPVACTFTYLTTKPSINILP